MHTLNFFWGGGVPCSHAHNLLTCDQPDPKNKFSPIQKIHFDPKLRDGPLKWHILLCEQLTFFHSFGNYVESIPISLVTVIKFIQILLV